MRVKINRHGSNGNRRITGVVKPTPSPVIRRSFPVAKNISSITENNKKYFQNRYNKWTEEEDEAVVQLRAEGKHILEISYTLNRTPDAVRNRCMLLRKKNEE